MTETYELTELELLEISRVGAGDDPLAKVALLKNKEESDVTEENSEELEKGVKIEIEVHTPDEELALEQLDMQQEAQDGMTQKTRKSYKAEAEALAEANEALMEELDTFKAKVEVLEKALQDKADVEKAKPEEMLEFDGEMIAKSAIPAPILKKLEEDKAALEEIKKVREKEALEKRAEEILPNTIGTVEKKAKMLKALEGDEEMLEMLRAIDAAFASHFEEVGKGKAVEFESPQDELDSMIKAYMDEHNVEKAKATVEVTKSGAGRELLLKTQKKETK